ncbi:MAG: hypothetical protein ACOY3P_10665, partial [Planctomycetota bacterium]
PTDGLRSTKGNPKVAPVAFPRMKWLIGLLCCSSLLGGTPTSPLHVSVAAEREDSSSAAVNKVPTADGVVVPRRPVAEAISLAMEFLKKADGAYKPGSIDGELAGYFTSAFVNEDGSRSDRQLAFPARQHAYFIFTFLRYQGYSGEREWLLRARDLADWNLAHSTPPDAAYPNLPYSLADLYAVTGDETAKRKAVSGINALTYMQSPDGLFRTFFQLVNERSPEKKRPNWYSQHLYTVCHVLEAMRVLPELAPAGKDGN